MEVLQRPAAGGQQRGSTWLRGGDGLLDELGLVAVAVGGDHGVAGDAGRDGGAVVARRPSSSPAWASANAPVQIDSSRAPRAAAARRLASTDGGGGRNTAS